MAFHHIRIIDWQIVSAHRLIELDGYVPLFFAFYAQDQSSSRFLRISMLGN